MISRMRGMIPVALAASLLVGLLTPIPAGAAEAAPMRAPEGVPVGAFWEALNAPPGTDDQVLDPGISEPLENDNGVTGEGDGGAPADPAGPSAPETSAPPTEDNDADAPVPTEDPEVPLPEPAQAPTAEQPDDDILWPLTEEERAEASEKRARELAATQGTLSARSSPSSGFQAGYIISDSNFYNGNAMSAAQIQTFLNQRVPRCTLGDAGREMGRPWEKTTLAWACLKNAKWNTTSLTRPANAYCNAYKGASGESSAAVIAKVAKACGISPKVLLVMLEKEQSLVTDTFPTARQFDRAMGYNCPDSGPNNSANCNAKDTGFMQQVYRSAWQLKVYRANSHLYRYKPFQTNTVQWHPNIGCGTSQVYIENWATAALYIYTPYRPNTAALNAGWGTGNNCSSYGNRNFFQFYKQWFGSPNSFFPDVTQGHKFYKEIEWMGTSGLSTGFKNATGSQALYKPRDSVTREAMAAFLFRLSGEKFTAPKSSPFSDVQPGHKFYKEITWMHAKKISTGNKVSGKKPRYAPGEQVSREAMAAFIYRFEKANYKAPATSPFADMKRGDKFYREITWMHSAKLSTGNKQPSGKPKYAPKDKISREAMAAFIYRLRA